MSHSELVAEKGLNMFLVLFLHYTSIDPFACLMNSLARKKQCVNIDTWQLI